MQKRYIPNYKYYLNDLYTIIECSIRALKMNMSPIQEYSFTPDYRPIFPGQIDILILRDFLPGDYSISNGEKSRHNITDFIHFSNFGRALPKTSRSNRTRYSCNRATCTMYIHPKFWRKSLIRAIL